METKGIQCSLDYADSSSAEELLAGDILVGDVGVYQILKFVGQGCFGKVARCFNQRSGETVAVKIMSQKASERELAMLRAISVLDPEQNNLVKFLESFEGPGHTCLAFEMLDINLYSYIKHRDFVPLSLKKVRSIAVQLMVALEALRGISILHTDLKPDNIMLVGQRPFRVKVIDFGVAMPTSHAQPGQNIQPEGYRAPEIDLGLPFSEPIDVWSVGCVLAFLYLADNFFPVTSVYQRMKFLVEVLGQPEDRQLEAGLHTTFFFKKDGAPGDSKWRLMTPEEFTRANGVAAGKREASFEQPWCLEDLVHISPVHQAAELEDRRAFVGLLKEMLHLEADQRICPRPALQHPFLTVSHLQQPESRNYLISSKIQMAGCSRTSPPVHSSSPPVHSSSPPVHSSFHPVKTYSLPARCSSLVVQSFSPSLQSSSLPTLSCSQSESSSPPHQSSSPPVYSFFHPVHSSFHPVKTYSLPARSCSLAVQSFSPSLQSSSLPTLSSSPSESSSPPHQSSSLLAQSSSPPHQSSSPPRHSSSAPPEFSTLPLQSSSPLSDSPPLPVQFSSPPSRSVFPGCLKKLWRRMGRIFSGKKPKLCSCLRPKVED